MHHLSLNSTEAQLAQCMHRKLVLLRDSYASRCPPRKHFVARDDSAIYRAFISRLIVPQSAQIILDALGAPLPECPSR